MIIHPSQFQEFWGYKYVRFSDGNVRFCDAASYCDSHKGIVDEYRHPIMPGDPLGGQAVPPFSAGKIRVRGKKWRIVEGGSTTLRLSRRDSDEKYIDRYLSQFGFHFDPEIDD